MATDQHLAVGCILAILEIHPHADRTYRIFGALHETAIVVAGLCSNGHRFAISSALPPYALIPATLDREVGNFSAYGFAPASLVAPLGTTTVIANMFIAACLLKERLYPSDMFGCMISVLGAFLLNEKVLDSVELQHHLVSTPFLVYMSFELLMMVFLFVLKLRIKIDSVMILIPITAILASFTVISAKAVSGMIQLTFAGHMQLNQAIFYAFAVVMLFTGIVQVKFLNEALRLFDATTVVPIHFVFFTMSAIVSGIIFYNEFWSMILFDIAMFLLGCILCFVGVYFISISRRTVSQSNNDWIKATPLSSTPTANQRSAQSERCTEEEPFVHAPPKVVATHSRNASNTSNNSRATSSAILKSC